MNDDRAIQQQWDTLLAAHRALVLAYLEALGTQHAPLLALQVRATSINVGALAELLGLPLISEPR